MVSAAIRAVQFDTRSGRKSWTVVDASGLPIIPIEDFLGVLRATMSVNTVCAYARHLSLLWRWLDARQLDWERIKFPELTEFLLTYRRGIYPLESSSGERAESSAKAVAAAVKEFFDYHRIEGRGPSELSLSRAVRYSATTSHRFLAHVERRRPVAKNRLTQGMRARPARPKIVQFEDDFDRLIAAAESWRDKLLISALYDGGLRIGQALGLRHEDLHIAERDLMVVRRDDNPNGALSKSKHSYPVRMPKRFFDLYSQYLLKELVPAEIENELLFVTLHGPTKGAACSYSNIYQQITAIGDRAGIPDLYPHMLRHTHATKLVKDAGWTAAQVAARLGQTHASSSNVYVHLAAEDLADQVDDFHRYLANERQADAP